MKAEQEGSAFVAAPGVDLCEILCVQEERQVGNDNCVSFNRLKLQIPERPLRAHFVKARVKVRCYPDGTYAIFHGPRCLARRKRRPEGRKKSRWNPLGGQPVEMWTRLSPCPQSHRRTKAEAADI